MLRTLASRRIHGPVLPGWILFLSACSAGSVESASPTDLELGAKVYSQSCASCHGANLQGTDKGPSHLASVYREGHHPDAAFESAIANGAPRHHWSFGDMPAVPGLDETEVAAVIAYIRSEQQRQGFEP